MKKLIVTTLLLFAMSSVHAGSKSRGISTGTALIGAAAIGATAYALGSSNQASKQESANVNKIHTPVLDNPSHSILMCKSYNGNRCDGQAYNQNLYHYAGQAGFKRLHKVTPQFDAVNNQFILIMEVSN